MRYISALDMHFSATVRQCHSAAVKIIGKFIFLTSKLSLCRSVVLLSSVFCVLFSVFCSLSYAEIIDRVVAYVDDTAITLSEFQENYIKMKKTVTDITEEDVLKSMINRLLLIKEAKKMKLEAATNEDLLKDYIDIKISSLIHIKEDAINQFYMEHINEFKGKDYLSVRDEIEKYLFEMETNKQLKRHLEELIANAEVKIQLKDK